MRSVALLVMATLVAVALGQSSQPGSTPTVTYVSTYNLTEETRPLFQHICQRIRDEYNGTLNQEEVQIKANSRIAEQRTSVVAGFNSQSGAGANLDGTYLSLSLYRLVDAAAFGKVVLTVQGETEWVRATLDAQKGEADRRVVAAKATLAATQFPDRVQLIVYALNKAALPRTTAAAATTSTPKPTGGDSGSQAPATTTHGSDATQGSTPAPVVVYESNYTLNNDTRPLFQQICLNIKADLANANPPLTKEAIQQQANARIYARIDDVRAGYVSSAGTSPNVEISTLLPLALYRLLDGAAFEKVVLAVIADPEWKSAEPVKQRGEADRRVAAARIALLQGSNTIADKVALVRYALANAAIPRATSTSATQPRPTENFPSFTSGAAHPPSTVAPPRQMPISQLQLNDNQRMLFQVVCERVGREPQFATVTSEALGREADRRITEAKNSIGANVEDALTVALVRLFNPEQFSRLVSIIKSEAQWATSETSKLNAEADARIQAARATVPKQSSSGAPVAETAIVSSSFEIAISLSLNRLNGNVTAGNGTSGNPNSNNGGNTTRDVPRVTNFTNPLATGDKPPTPTGDKPPTPSGDRPPVTSGDRPPTPTGDKPPTPSGDRPPVTSGDRPPTPTGDKPPTPSGDRPPVTSGDKPAPPPVPTGDKPPTPSGDRPPVTSGDKPQEPTRTSTSKAPSTNGIQVPTHLKPFFDRIMLQNPTMSAADALKQAAAQYDRAAANVTAAPSVDTVKTLVANGACEASQKQCYGKCIPTAQECKCPENFRACGTICQRNDVNCDGTRVTSTSGAPGVEKPKTCPERDATKPFGCPGSTLCVSTPEECCSERTTKAPTVSFPVVKAEDGSVVTEKVSLGATVIAVASFDYDLCGQTYPPKFEYSATDPAGKAVTVRGEGVKVAFAAAVAGTYTIKIKAISRFTTTIFSEATKTVEVAAPPTVVRTRDVKVEIAATGKIALPVETNAKTITVSCCKAKSATSLECDGECPADVKAAAATQVDTTAATANVAASSTNKFLVAATAPTAGFTSGDYIFTVSSGETTATVAVKIAAKEKVVPRASVAIDNGVNTRESTQLTAAIPDGATVKWTVKGDDGSSVDVASTASATIAADKLKPAVTYTVTATVTDKDNNVATISREVKTAFRPVGTCVVQAKDGADTPVVASVTTGIVAARFSGYSSTSKIQYRFGFKTSNGKVIYLTPAAQDSEKFSFVAPLVDGNPASSDVTFFASATVDGQRDAGYVECTTAIKAAPGDNSQVGKEQAALAVKAAASKDVTQVANLANNALAAVRNAETTKKTDVQRDVLSSITTATASADSTKPAVLSASDRGSLKTVVADVDVATVTGTKTESPSAAPKTCDDACKAAAANLVKAIDTIVTSRDETTGKPATTDKETAQNLLSKLEEVKKVASTTTAAATTDVDTRKAASNLATSFAAQLKTDGVTDSVKTASTTVSAAAVDPASLAVRPAVTTGEKVSVTLPKDFTIAGGDTAKSVAVTIVEGMSSATKNGIPAAASVGPSRHVDVTADGVKLVAANLPKKIELSFDVGASSEVDITKKNIKVYYLNTVSGNWETTGVVTKAATVNAAGRVIVTADVDHCTEFTTATEDKPADATPNTPADGASQAASATLSTGTIVAIAVGSVLFVAAVVGVLVAGRKRTPVQDAKQERLLVPQSEAELQARFGRTAQDRNQSMIQML